MTPSALSARSANVYVPSPVTSTVTSYSTHAFVPSASGALSAPMLVVSFRSRSRPLVRSCRLPTVMVAFD
jgi:hypothetical protein